MEMDRFDRIMARVDAWAEEGAGWDCRDEAVAEVRWLLGIGRPDGEIVPEMSDEDIAESAINAWMSAE